MLNRVISRNWLWFAIAFTGGVCVGAWTIYFLDNIVITRWEALYHELAGRCTIKYFM